MYKQQCEKAAGRKDNHSNGEGVPQLQGPSPNPIPPYCHKLRLWGCQRAPGCAGPQAVSTHGSQDKPVGHSSEKHRKSGNSGQEANNSGETLTASVPQHSALLHPRS